MGHRLDSLTPTLCKDAILIVVGLASAALRASLGGPRGIEIPEILWAADGVSSSEWYVCMAVGRGMVCGECRREGEAPY